MRRRIQEKAYRKTTSEPGYRPVGNILGALQVMQIYRKHKSTRRPRDRNTIEIPRNLDEFTLVGALYSLVERLCDHRPNVNGHGLVDACERGGEVAEVLAVVGDIVAEELEGEDARLALVGVAQDSEGGDLVHVGADVDNIAAGAEDEVVDEEMAKVLVADEVGE